MVGVRDFVLGAPKPKDTVGPILAKQEKAAQADKERLQKQESDKRRSGLAGRLAGRRSLFSDGETGLKTTLG